MQGGDKAKFLEGSCIYVSRIAYMIQYTHNNDHVHCVYNIIVISTQCHPTIERGFCFKGTCSGDGYCRCPNSENRDECTCLGKPCSV